MIDLRNVLANPELIRNVRINLRAKRMLVAAIVVALVSIVAIPSMLSTLERGIGPTAVGKYYLTTVLVIQAIVLLFGGGIACLQSISREKELNTFDYQRITRLSPLDLAIGKLLGAPSMAYFVFACFIPAALLGLLSSSYSLGDVLDAYALLILGALSFHALTLMLSMLLSRSLSTGAILVFLLIASFTGLPWLILITLKANHTIPGSTDIPFFGAKIPFTPFFTFLYASLTAWFMLALMRNIKRDPSAYELYTPLQALAFAGYLNFLFVGCMGSAKLPFEAAVISSTWINRAIFFGLGLVLLRNRERSRRRLRELGEAGLSWLEAFWPIPYLLGGMLVAGFLPLFFTGPDTVASAPRFPNSAAPATLDFSLLIFRSAFVGLSLSRDVMFLQWMNVRPGRRPFVRGFLYLTAYYCISSALFFSAGSNLAPAEAAFQSVFAPMRAFLLTQASWTQATAAWMLALVAQCVIIWFFAFLHRQELLSLATRPKKNLPPGIPTGLAAPAR